tara:strand:+ start:20 stop:664 length:645 start_codon:yes stop_codon:yes gene_type:complete
MSLPFKFISIEGNIGSGKTSLVNKIINDFKGKVILEEFAENPFLPDFYKEPEKHAFPLEMFFMAERFQQLSSNINHQDLFSELTVADYSFFKSKLFAQNNLKENELDLFNRLYNIMFSSIKKPDLLIYLHSDIKRLQQNIKKRGRKYERNISDNYLKSIETRYFNYINKQNSYNVLILDVTNVNFIKDQSIYAEIIAEINKFDKSKKIIRKILT